MSDLPTAGNAAAAYPTPGAALAAAPPPPKRFDLRRGLLLGGIIAFIALCGIAVLSYLGWRLGPIPLTIGILASILPVPVLVFCFLWLDRYEPEPVWYLAIIFAWGAFVATGVALLLNNTGSLLLHRWHLPDGLTAVLVAPLVEESMKALGPV